MNGKEDEASREDCFVSKSLKFAEFLKQRIIYFITLVILQSHFATEVKGLRWLITCKSTVQTEMDVVGGAETATVLTGREREDPILNQALSSMRPKGSC